MMGVREATFSADPSSPPCATMSIGDVIGAYVAMTGVKLADLQGQVKTAAIARPRHELMYILRQLTAESQSAIGSYLGGRDMATVHAGVANVADRIAADPDYRKAIADLVARIRSAQFRPDPVADWRQLAALSVLRDPHLTDAEARKAAQQLLLGEAPHGA